MKIVHIITRLILGGAQENTLITCEQLAKRGHDVTLITGPAIGPEGQLFQQAEGKGYKIVVVEDMVREISPVKDLKSYFRIKRILREIGPDIVHTHSAKAGILGRFASKAACPAAKVVHTVHGLAFHPYLSKIRNAFYIAMGEGGSEQDRCVHICGGTRMSEKMLGSRGSERTNHTRLHTLPLRLTIILRRRTLMEIRGFRRKIRY